MVGSGRGHMSISRNDIAASARGAILTLISYPPTSRKDEPRAALRVLGSRPRIAGEDRFVGLPDEAPARAGTRHRGHGSPDGVEQTALRSGGEPCPTERCASRPAGRAGLVPG